MEEPKPLNFGQVFLEALMFFYLLVPLTCTFFSLSGDWHVYRTIRGTFHIKHKYSTTTRGEPHQDFGACSIWEMEAPELLGFVLSSGDALLRTYSELEKCFRAQRELALVLQESKMRARRICSSVDRYSIGINKDAVPANELRRARKDLEEINSELQAILDKHGNSSNWQRRFRSPKKQFRNCNQQLRELERELERFGVMSREAVPLREQLVAVVKEARKIVASHDDAQIAKVVEKLSSDINVNIPPDDDNICDDVDVIPQKARHLLNALSKSRLPEGKKNELSEMARKICDGWKINSDDVVFDRKPSGDRTRIGKGGTAEVYLGTIKFRDEKGNHVPGDTVEVAVKQFGIETSEAKEGYAQFIRDVLLQKHTEHPCIVQTLGGQWPSPEQIAGSDVIEPSIVMERMTHTLRQVQDKKFLGVLSRRRILADIAAGIEHLHRRGIVHGDIKPENVLLRVFDRKIVGRAKLSDFSVSRKRQMTTTSTNSKGIAGTLAYMPPEAFSGSARPARDIWSFGVLMCEVLFPDFIGALVKERPDGLHLIAGGGEFARKVAERATVISCDEALKQIAVSCLALNPKRRPQIEDVYDQLVCDGPKYSFPFINCLSKDYRASEVLRYVRKHFNVEAKTIDPISVLENAVREENNSSATISAQNVLAYCYLFGIGVEKDEKKSKEFFELGCTAGDSTALLAKSVVKFWAQEYAIAVPLLSLAADSGSHGAHGAKMWLAACFRYGHGVEKNENHAFKLLSSSANAGNKYAQAWLASYLRVGIGTAKDEPRALALLHGLSAIGNAFASMWLALWYKEGLVVPKDEDKAKGFLRMARKGGIVGSWVFKEEHNWWEITGKSSSYDFKEISPASSKDDLPFPGWQDHTVDGVLTSGDACLSAYPALEQHHESRRNVVDLLLESKMRVYRLYGSIERYSRGMNKTTIPQNVLRRAGKGFQDIKDELSSLPPPVDYMERVLCSNEKLTELEDYLKATGIMMKSLREQFQEVAEAVLKIDADQLGREIPGLLESIDRNLKDRDCSSIDSLPKVQLSNSKEADLSDLSREVDFVPEQARKLLNALSKSGLPDDKRLELSEMARKVWEGWKVNRDNFQFVRKPNGDRKRLGKGGAASVYLARMKLQDENGNIIAGETMEVAVKQFLVRISHAETRFPIFMREVFLQKHAYHPCVVRTFGGYWPDAEEVRDETEIEPYIVMERMSYNLIQLRDMSLLKSIESKRRVLRDIAAGIEHLHRCGIVHRDIKPENVLVNVDDGKIIGRAKVCDFGVSRKAEETHATTVTIQTFTRPTGTSLYMPPEAFSKTARGSSKRARDIWSFGVLMCEVLVPDFLSNIARNYPEGVQAITNSGQFAEEVAKSVQTISCEPDLGELAVSCLSLDPKMRPRIADVASKLENGMLDRQVRTIEKGSSSSG